MTRRADGPARNADLVHPRHGTARVAARRQIRRFCVRWQTIVISQMQMTGHAASYRYLPPTQRRLRGLAVRGSPIAPGLLRCNGGMTTFG